MESPSFHFHSSVWRLKPQRFSIQSEAQFETSTERTVHLKNVGILVELGILVEQFWSSISGVLAEVYFRCKSSFQSQDLNTLKELILG